MRTFGVTKNYEPPQEGAQHVVVSDEIELGLQASFDGTDKNWQYGVRLEFPADKTEEGTPKTIWVAVNESLHPKSRLGKIFAAIGRMPARGEDVSIAKLHGGNMTVVIEHVIKEDRKYANVVSFTKLPPGAQPVEPVISRGNVPEWLQKKQIAGGMASATPSVNATYTSEAEKVKAEITAGCDQKW